MRKNRRRLWIVLFVSIAVLLSILATGWNVVLVHDYQHLVELAKKLSAKGEITIPPARLILRMILGTLGFVTTLALSVLIFIRLLHEMRLNQLQSEFLATISHELKTPIAAIELSASLIRAGGLPPEETQKLWNSHQVELKRLREEVDALLEAARWQSKVPTPQKTPLFLEDWIQQSFEHWQATLGPKAILLREGEPLTLQARVDLRSMNLIMDNLLSNARKFSFPPPHVIIQTHRLAKSRWQIQVIDQGWGFTPGDSKKIFHRFFRSRNQNSYTIPGTGLGLYLASSASRAMGLSLKGQSEGSEQGARFILEGPEFRS